MAVPEQWKIWVTENVSLGVKTIDILSVLMENDFTLEEVSEEIPELYNALYTQQLYIPSSERLSTTTNEAFILKQFLNKEECLQLADIITSHLKVDRFCEHRSVVELNNPLDLSSLNQPFIESLETRICKIIGMSSDYAEPLQGYYSLDNRFDNWKNDLLRCNDQLPQNTLTFLIYISNNEEIEATFTYDDLKLSLDNGTVLIWSEVSNGLSETSTTFHLTHSKDCEKIIVTKKFKLRHGRYYPILKEENEYLKPYSKKGFNKTQLSPSVFNALTNFFQQNKAKKSEERIASGALYNSSNAEVTSSLISLPDELKTLISLDAKTLIENWLNIAIEPTYVYGIRVYHRNSVLKLHRDRIKTHVFGAIINVDQKVEEDWPLEIEDTLYRLNKVFLQPGDVLLYESARLSHGRPSPLRGDYFVNVFCHYIPRDPV
jgi:prolyl 4-hydroxylase